MRKILSIFLVFILVVNIITFLPFKITATGTVEGVPISSTGEFNSMQPDGLYYLTADITISATYTVEFSGTLNGNGHIVTVFVPLFNTFSGMVTNLNIEGSVDFSNTSNSAGALACEATNAEFSNITNRASVIGTGLTGGVVGKAIGSCSFYNVKNQGEITGGQTGGIIGFCENTTTDKISITDCQNEGNITASDYGGGIVASVNSIGGLAINGCLNFGNVQTTAYKAVGGIIGFISQPDSIIGNCTNKGNVTGLSQTGGILGYSNHALIMEYCINDSEAIISGSGTSNYSGGIASRVGMNNFDNTVALFKNCINKGSVQTKKDHCGGILAYSTISAIFDTCLNYGSVKGVKSTGGIAGYINCYGQFIRCINYGSVESTNFKAGGISGSIGTDCPDVYTYKYEGCGNEGSVKGRDYSSGIAAFLYGGMNKTVSIKYCYNIGRVESTESYVTGLLGITNNIDNPFVSFNYIAGEFIAPYSYSYGTVYLDCDRINSGANHHNNYILRDTVDYIKHKTDLGDVEITSNYEYLFLTDEMNSGELTYNINSAVGVNVFFQTLDIDDYPTTALSHHAVGFNSEYYNLPKATFVNGNEVTYIDTEAGESFTVPVGEGVLYWYCGTDICIPKAAYQIAEDVLFEAKPLSLQTRAGASVRIAVGSTGLRFYTQIDRADYDEIQTQLTNSQYVLSFGTVITPKSYVDDAVVFTMEALNGINRNSVKYLDIPSSGIYETTNDYYVIAGSIVNLTATEGKSDHRALDFAAIGYIAITDTIQGDTYILYSTSYSVRNVSDVASAALSDVSNSGTQEYLYMVQSGIYNSKYSPYTAQQRQILEGLVIN